MRRWLLGLVVAAAAVVLSACDIDTQAFVVDATHDAPAANPGDGVCDDGTGACTLRAAIDEANALDGLTGITLEAGATYTLTIDGPGEDDNATGDLDIHRLVLLVGNGATIDAAGLDRAFDVHPTGALLAIDVAVTGGHVRASTSGETQGGAIRARGNLTLRDSVVHDNTIEIDVALDELETVDDAPGGAAIHANALWLNGTHITDNHSIDDSGDPTGILGAVAATTQATVTNTTIDHNTAGPFGIAGGLYTPQLTMTTSAINHNQITGEPTAFGAGVFVDSGSIDRSEISWNSIEDSGFGGGVTAGGDLTLTDSRVESNSATSGGGIYAFWWLDETSGSLNLHRTAIVGNEATQSGGGIELGAGVGGPGSRTAEIRDSSILDNTASDGGGIASFWSPSVEIHTSTISGNRAIDSISGQGAGGAIASYHSTLSVISGTVTANEADGSGGGIYGYGGSVSLASSVVGAQSQGSDCATDDGASIASGGYNLDSDGSCGLDQPSDQPGVDPQLGPLADNGGPTPTHHPLVGSSLRDQIPLGTNGCGDHPDQRGVPRPQGTHCDIGAVEADPPPTDLFVTATHDAPDANPGDGLCDDGTGACTLRAAIDEANALAGHRTIHLQPDTTYTLTIEGAGEDHNATGDLDVRDHLTIEGNGATIDAGGDTGIADRVLEAHETAAIAISDLTITGGRLTDPTWVHGGGLLVWWDAALDNVTVVGNHLTCTDGFGVCDPDWDYEPRGGGIAAYGELTLVSSTVSDNVLRTGSTDFASYAGGGVGAEDVVITDSQVTGNRIEALDPQAQPAALARGGGISAVTLTMHSTLVADNLAEELLVFGGGISAGTTDITHSTVQDNVARSTDQEAGWSIGGGLEISNGSIKDSTVARNTTAANTTDGVGGGIAVDSGDFEVTRTAIVENSASEAGGGVWTLGHLTVTDSLVSGNDGGLMGGGMLLGEGSAAVERSAIVGNRAEQGGGIAWFDTYRVTIRTSTISSNEAIAHPDRPESGRGGGVYMLFADAADILDLHHTTFAANAAADTGSAIFAAQELTVTTASSVIAGPSGTDACGGNLSLTSGGYNLDSDGSCGLDQPSDQPGVDPQLGPLADNGGPTPTHHPLVGSPLRDQIPLGTNGCGDHPDQRGVPRPQGTHCDIGAVEVET